MTQTTFKNGSKVALVRYGSFGHISVSKFIVDFVRKNGTFHLQNRDGTRDPTLWEVSDRNEREANPKGKGYTWKGYHCIIMDEEFKTWNEKRLADRDQRVRRNNVKSQMASLYYDSMSDQDVEALEAIIAKYSRKAAMAKKYGFNP